MHVNEVWTDYETDTVIQRSLREAISKDVTVLTIAHRLQTIMDADKIVSANPGGFMAVLINRSCAPTACSGLRACGE